MAGYSAGLFIGAIIGTLAAKKVKMTAMPEMVSMFNGMGGACAMLISIVEFNHLYNLMLNLEHAISTFSLLDNCSCRCIDYNHSAGIDYWFCFICRKYDRLGKIEWKGKRFFF